MLSKNPVLPNFLKLLTVMVFALVAAISYAGHHEKGKEMTEEKIVELKQMTPEADATLEDQVDGELTDRDAAAAEDALAEDIDEAAKEITDESDPLVEED